MGRKLHGHRLAVSIYPYVQDVADSVSRVVDVIPKRRRLDACALHQMKIGNDALQHVRRYVANAVGGMEATDAQSLFLKDSARPVDLNRWNSLRTWRQCHRLNIGRASEGLCIAAIQMVETTETTVKVKFAEPIQSIWSNQSCCRQSLPLGRVECAE